MLSTTIKYKLHSRVLTVWKLQSKIGHREEFEIICCIPTRVIQNERVWEK